ncbi:hypothetical protein GCM10010302_12270 [Streptomyces polychromogenes]|uniref:Uncharacterized protein n=1 Tax=Streptomyces polychromogenes TaxID=67342 RepID=A0ABP3EUH8_9ACTN
MNLRKFVVATALGATVLTAVPALVAPHEAAASACDQLSECGNTTGDESGGGGWDDGGSGNGGGDDGSGGGDDGSGGGGDGGGGEVVVIEGSIDRGDTLPSVPRDPDEPTVTVESGGVGGGGGGGGGDSVVRFREGPIAQMKTGCVRNTSDATLKVLSSAKYTVSYKVNTDITATVEKALSLKLGAELNTSIEKSVGYEVTIAPGQSWALAVDYQTVEFAVTTTNWLGQTTTDWVNVVMPTGTVNSVSC